MAETHHKPETHTPTTTRAYTVGYVSDTKYQPVPAVTLKGHWMADAGFETDTPVDVRVMKDCLVITTKPKPPQIPLTREMLYRTEALPDKARQELCTLICALLIREWLRKVAAGE